MGDPRKQRKTYSRPIHPWQKDRIETEKALAKTYGLKRKNEIWKVNSQLKHFYEQAKDLIASTKATADTERAQFLKRLNTLGLLEEGSQLTDVLNIQLKDLMERRLQTLVLRKGMAGTIDQARQFIVHEHISVAGKKITTPSYVVTVEQEPTIVFAQDSTIKDENHPERQAKKQKDAKQQAESQKAEQKEKEAEEKKESESKDESSEEKKESKPAKKPAKKDAKESKEEVKEQKPAESKDAKEESKSKE